MDENEDLPPEGLGARGLAFWDALTGPMVFSVAEREYLIEACRTLDRIDDLSEQVTTDGAVIAGSMGQKILHPAIAEVRMLQASFLRLVGALNLPEDKAASEKFRTRRAKAGAAARHGLKAV
ncbi:hypothetical protein JOF42_002440 [Microbacterium phyllosphaerae]|uniref:Terminase small subunit n=1 Tax=Microbacterium phyllosphaerae TaxID=124798 RepID=A0ABS4WRV3_9MICO|nr:hypothetical protein [Microbacterium phyllosphaerae]MBP2378945.1 hypothetical protein [Microbacterium phyllosphaerae]